MRRVPQAGPFLMEHRILSTDHVEQDAKSRPVSVRWGFLPSTGFQGTNPEIHFHGRQPLGSSIVFRIEEHNVNPDVRSFLAELASDFEEHTHTGRPVVRPVDGLSGSRAVFVRKGRVSQCANNSTRSRDSGWKVPMMFFMFRMVPSKARRGPPGRHLGPVSGQFAASQSAQASWGAVLGTRGPNAT